MHAREALRRHIDAVWHLQLPSLDAPDITLAPDLPLPPWAIYQAQIGQEQITIWRPQTASEEQARLLALTAEVAHGGDVSSLRREVVLLPPPSDQIDEMAGGPTPRLLTAQDFALLEAFDPGGGTSLLQPACAPCVGVIVDDALVCVAHSSRRTTVACELGIDTVPAARRHGYALAATRRWTAQVRQEGRLPIYSALAANTASLRLAAAAGFTLLARGIYGPMPIGHDE